MCLSPAHPQPWIDSSFPAQQVRPSSSPGAISRRSDGRQPTRCSLTRSLGHEREAHSAAHLRGGAVAGATVPMAVTPVRRSLESFSAAKNASQFGTLAAWAIARGWDPLAVRTEALAAAYAMGSAPLAELERYLGTCLPLAMGAAAAAAAMATAAAAAGQRVPRQLLPAPLVLPAVSVVPEKTPCTCWRGQAELRRRGGRVRPSRPRRVVPNCAASAVAPRGVEAPGPVA